MKAVTTKVCYSVYSHVNTEIYMSNIMSYVMPACLCSVISVCVCVLVAFLDTEERLVAISRTVWTGNCSAREGHGCYELLRPRPTSRAQYECSAPGARVRRLPGLPETDGRRCRALHPGPGMFLSLVNYNLYLLGAVDFIPAQHASLCISRVIMCVCSCKPRSDAAPPE